jgi:benzoyl-CoA reductase/2-hydroxyglutaryl-CoA dehydratase subunit BcrC/BadD/HgdB
LQRIGFTTTIPLEILVAAKRQPVDLNNLFITSGRSHELIEEAELAGFPRNVCGWIKGIYAAVLENGIRVLVPPFISAGERIIVDTNEITYVRRAD